MACVGHIGLKCDDCGYNIQALFDKDWKYCPKCKGELIRYEYQCYDGYYDDYDKAEQEE